MENKLYMGSVVYETDGASVAFEGAGFGKMVRSLSCLSVLEGDGPSCAISSGPVLDFCG